MKLSQKMLSLLRTNSSRPETKLGYLSTVDIFRDLGSDEMKEIAEATAMTTCPVVRQNTSEPFSRSKPFGFGMAVRPRQSRNSRSARCVLPGRTHGSCGYQMQSPTLRIRRLDVRTDDGVRRPQRARQSSLSSVIESCEASARPCLKPGEFAYPDSIGCNT